MGCLVFLVSNIPVGSLIVIEDLKYFFKKAFLNEGVLTHYDAV